MVKFTTRNVSLLLLILMLMSIVPAFAQDDSGIIAYTTTADGTSRIVLVDGSGNAVSVSDGQGNDFYPTLSPDGSQIAFVSDRSGNLEIYVANSDGSNVTPLTNNDYNDVSPSWSPDGTQIAFASDRDGDLDIYITDLQGNAQQVAQGSSQQQQQVIADDSNEWAPSWSPDGDLIAFTSDRDVDSEIYVFNRNSGEVHNMTNYPRGDDAYPSWSPDGRTVAFSSSRTRGGVLQIFTIDVNGGDALQVTTGSDDNQYPTWSPDGSQLAYMTGSDQNTAVAIINVGGGDPQFLTNADGSGYPSWWSLR